jgi:hypothetical protein
MLSRVSLRPKASGPSSARNPQKEGKNDDDGVALLLGCSYDPSDGTMKTKQTRNFKDLKVFKCHYTFRIGARFSYGSKGKPRLAEGRRRAS